MEKAPFKIQVPGEQLEELARRLAATTWSPEYANEDWRYGVSGTYLRELVDYWQNHYDWRSVERTMNRYSHYRATLSGIPIHFIHEPGKGPAPRPLILSHGWPMTFWDMSRLIGPLTDPAAYGADPNESFDVIVPSLPGFGFSSPLTRPGVNFWETADLWVELMNGLGYRRFFAHGGDWGSLITSQLGHRYPQQVIAIHQTSAPALDRHCNSPTPWQVDLRRAAVHVATSMIDPQTLAWAMHDSPVGMLAWLLERRRSWSDCDGDVEACFSKDDLLTGVMIYWLTDTFVTSIRYYYEANAKPWTPDRVEWPVVPVPTGLTFFEHENVWTQPYHERYYNLVYSRNARQGGHFGAWEQAEIVVEDIRTTFRGR